MNIATAEIMKEIDKYTIDKVKIPGIVLMENAALRVIKNLDLSNNQNFVVVCGSGNNGGDGFAVARHLILQDKSVEVFLIGQGSILSEDAKLNYNILKNMGVEINNISNLDDIHALRNSLLYSQVTIDAIFGTGLKRQLEEPYDSAISIINENSKYVISIDTPSGMDSNNGKALGNCIKADKTISFQLYKRGFLGYGTDKYTGEIIVEDIGIPTFVIERFHKNEFMLEEDMIRHFITSRDRYAYKGDYGRTTVIAGSIGFTGAAYITTQSVVRTGAGLVTLACREEIYETLSSKLIEAMVTPFLKAEELKYLIDKSDVIAFGPGIGEGDDTLEMLKYLIKNANCPIVIDADGLNVLQGNTDILDNKKSTVVLTPHLGEMAKITGLSIDYIRENRLEVAKSFAKEKGVIVLLKGYHTVITDGETTYINPTGNSAMASGGMGDCLTGIVAGFISQFQRPLESAYCAAFIHGYIGEKLSKDMFAVNASHVLEYIPYAIKNIKKNNYK
ncbi:NAD(P)H-hydrate dehydratase [Clostridium sp. MSJ-4]|uniref:Bifunctional NAD(P)H-hydrate repair enzyme n=1 Tax=Clostridium simiarum TaxID=2841506 RepID=A0ABS6F2P8_9CLOT|nr:NAD(P)H-hydrate dehydratase [Clostridium simiarum]MBU5592571.1 NAD(P)H-hydrate dehydratase [Clostridium simiarum]